METELRVEVTPEDFRLSPNGYSLPSCPLYNALKRMYPDEYLYVGHNVATIGSLLDQKRYAIPMKEWGDQKGNMPVETINELSKRAKKSLDEIPTVYLTLTLI